MAPEHLITCPRAHGFQRNIKKISIKEAINRAAGPTGPIVQGPSLSGLDSPGSLRPEEKLKPQICSVKIRIQLALFPPP